jgi:dual specificity tyrosine-phosphorylation-regulated kinase 2/3/4
MSRRPQVNSSVLDRLASHHQKSAKLKSQVIDYQAIAQETLSATNLKKPHNPEPVQTKARIQPKQPTPEDNFTTPKKSTMMERLAAGLAAQQKQPTRKKQVIDFQTISQEALTATYQRKPTKPETTARDLLGQPLPDSVKEGSGGMKQPSMMERLAANVAAQQKTTANRRQSQIIDYKSISQEALSATYQKKSPLQSTTRDQLRQPIPELVKESSGGMKMPSMMERLAANLAAQQKTTSTRRMSQIIDFKSITQEALSATYQKKNLGIVPLPRQTEASTVNVATQEQPSGLSRLVANLAAHNPSRRGSQIINFQSLSQIIRHKNPAASEPLEPKVRQQPRPATSEEQGNFTLSKQPSVKRIRSISPYRSKTPNESLASLSGRSERFSFKDASLMSNSYSRGRITTRTDMNGSGLFKRPSPNTSQHSKSFEAAELTEEDKKLEDSQPIAAKKAIEKYGDLLWDVEKQELLEYGQVYYFALKYKDSFEPTQYNGGFDNEEGYYVIRLGDHIAFRYRTVAFLGQGSFGTVVKVYDYKRSEYIALKILRNKRRFQRQGTVEIKVLGCLRKSDSEDQKPVVKMRNYFIFRGHICMTFELLSTNLYEYMRTSRFSGFPLKMLRRIAIQLLTAVQFTHANKVWHCDIKPDNILFTKPNKTSVKLADFGSACFENELAYSYIQSRYYRAPEIMLKLAANEKVDMWSVGCVLVELLHGVPLFPGENEHQMLLRIAEVFGNPPVHMQTACKNRQFYFKDDFTMLLAPDKKNRTRKPKTLPLASALRCSDQHFLQLIALLLKWDPEKRISAEEALQHPWILGKLDMSFIEEHFSKKAVAKLSRSFRL